MLIGYILSSCSEALQGILLRKIWKKGARGLPEVESDEWTIGSYPFDKRLGKFPDGLSVFEGHVVGPATKTLHLVRQVVVCQS